VLEIWSSPSGEKIEKNLLKESLDTFIFKRKRREKVVGSKAQWISVLKIVSFGFLKKLKVKHEPILTL